jgi:IclR helix-turn-helix domain
MLKQRAEEGLRLMQDAVVDLLAEHPDGMTNSQIARELGLHSDYEGHHQGYLSWSIMGLLLNSRKVEKRGRRYRLSEQ